MTYRILFVCAGNICRSPLAEGLFLHMVKEAGLEEQFVIDSAGTGGWHAGERPDARSQEVASRNGFSIPSLARQVTDDDYKNFDMLLAMDRSNYNELVWRIEDEEGEEEYRPKIRMMRDFDDPEFVGQDVPDPYFGQHDGFEKVFEMLKRSCTRLLEHLQKQGKLSE